jgi:hypothetical protein
MMNNWKLYMGDFLKSFVWSSMDHSKNNVRNNYIIFNPNYFISSSTTTYFFLLILKITISHLS